MPAAAPRVGQVSEELLIILIRQAGLASPPQIPDLSKGMELRSLLTAFLMDTLAMIDQNRELIKAVLPEMITDSELREDYVRQDLLPTMHLFRSMLQRSVPNEGGRAVNAWVVFPAMLGGAIAALLFNDYLELPMGSRLSREELVNELLEFSL